MLVLLTCKWEFPYCDRRSLLFFTTNFQPHRQPNVTAELWWATWVERGLWGCCFLIWTSWSLEIGPFQRWLAASSGLHSRLFHFQECLMRSAPPGGWRAGICWRNCTSKGVFSPSKVNLARRCLKRVPLRQLHIWLSHGKGPWTITSESPGSLWRCRLRGPWPWRTISMIKA